MLAFVNRGVPAALVRPRGRFPGGGRSHRSALRRTRSDPRVQGMEKLGTSQVWWRDLVCDRSRVAPRDGGAADEESSPAPSGLGWQRMRPRRQRVVCSVSWPEGRGSAAAPPVRRAPATLPMAIGAPWPPNVAALRPQASCIRAVSAQTPKRTVNQRAGLRSFRCPPSMGERTRRLRRECRPLPKSRTFGAAAKPSSQFVTADDPGRDSPLFLDSNGK